MENGSAPTYLGLKWYTQAFNECSYIVDALNRSSNPGHVYQTLLQAERVAHLSGKSVVGNAQMINITLDIKCQQYVDPQLGEHRLTIS